MTDATRDMLHRLTAELGVPVSLRVVRVSPYRRMVETTHADGRRARITTRVTRRRVSSRSSD